MVFFGVRITYKSNEKEKYLESPADGGDTANVSIADCGHGDHQEVDTVPVTQFLTVVKVRRVARILKLKWKVVRKEKVKKTQTQKRKGCLS